MTQTTPDLRHHALRMLERWAGAMRRHVHSSDPGNAPLFFGVGNSGHWAMQAQATALSGFAVLAADPDTDEQRAGVSREALRDTALGLFRFLCEAHRAGGAVCTDGRPWGHSWISGLCLERLMHALDALGAAITDEDRARLGRVLISECDWLLDQYRRRPDAPPGAVTAGLKADNHPENNIWNGAMLYRTTRLFPEAPRREEYIEKAARFLLNGISIEADAASDRPFAGRPLSDWHVGPNFYPSFALNHHGYLNVGYMNICLSNIAMLHFSCRLHGWPAPPGLYHHAAELWQRVKTFTFPDGRLCRIGGDTRVRYCYCQDYALPTWLWAQDYLRDPDAPAFEQGWLDQVEREQQSNPDGSFLGHRLQGLEAKSPLYYTRLEGDRAATVSMSAYWHRAFDDFREPPPETEPAPAPLQVWSDETHGACLTVEPDRIASWSWIGGQGPTGLCVPPGASDMAEWRMNLAGWIRGNGLVNIARPVRYSAQPFPGGFRTAGRAVIETSVFIAEGELPEEIALLDLAFAALPDGRTAVGFQQAVTPHRVRLAEVKGLSLLIPNDVYNGKARWYRGETLDERYVSRPGTEQNIPAGAWLNADDQVGILALGGEDLVLHRPAEAQIGVHATAGSPGRALISGLLYADEICLGATSSHPADYPGGTTLFDLAYALRTGIDAEGTRAWSEAAQVEKMGWETDPGIRAARIPGADENTYGAAVNFGDQPGAIRVRSEASLSPVGFGEKPTRDTTGAFRIELDPGEMQVWKEG